MKNDANIRNFIEISGKAHGKYAENHGIFKEFIPQPLAEEPVYAVISCRFQSFSVVFAVIPGFDSV